MLINTVKIEYINYDPKLHKDFGVISACNVFEKDNIVNVYLESNKVFNEIYDDIGYDCLGKHILISSGEWRNISTGEYISTDAFFDLEEFSLYDYDYVSFNVKIYTNKEFKVCYHNDCDRKLMLSLIPYSLLQFTPSNCNKEIYSYRK